MEVTAWNRTEPDVVGKLFRDKEELAMRYMIDMEYSTKSENSFEKTLMRLKNEMVQLMRCDVHLYKQLTELSNSIHDLKEEFKRYESYRPRFNSFTTSSSSDESFVSATDNLEVNSNRFNLAQTISEIGDNRILSWINNCEQFPTDNESTNDKCFGNFRQRSCSYGHYRGKDDALLKLNSETKCQDNHLHQLNDSDFPVKLSNSLMHKESKSQNMKTVEKAEIRSEEILSYYKSSLRLLGSVRMQSRIFEPVHTKYRSSALLHTIESFVSGPKPFLNIQPRPKLHRQNNVLELNEINISNERSSSLLAARTSNEKCQDNYTSAITTVTKEDQSEEEKHDDHASSDDHVNLDSNDAKESEEGLLRADSGFNEEFEELTDSESEVKNKPETEMEAFRPEFLHINDKMVTCRIMSPGLEEELANRKPESDDFEFLVLVDGRVSFIPHDIEESNTDESYCLAWMFEEMEDESRAHENMSEYFFIDNLFEADHGEVDDGMVVNSDETNYTCNSSSYYDLISNDNVDNSVLSKSSTENGCVELADPFCNQGAGGVSDTEISSLDAVSSHTHDISSSRPNCFLDMYSVKGLQKSDRDWSMDSGLGDDFSS